MMKRLGQQMTSVTVSSVFFLIACCGSAAELPKAAAPELSDAVKAKRASLESCTLSVTPLQEKNIYKVGEKASFQVTLLDPAKTPVTGQKICYTISSGDGRLQKNIVTKTGDKPYICEVALDAPGWIRVLATLLGENGQPLMKGRKIFSAGAGAMVEPEKIKAGCEEPADFKKFWDDQKALLAGIPVKAERTEVSLKGRHAAARFKCYDIKVDCVDKVPVSGYLSIPVGARPKSLPAVISFHGAGVASAGKPIRHNAISFDVNAHGILNGQSQEYYNRLYANELRAYFHRNKNDREKFYFRNMYLRVLRALDYVKTLPEWDGKNLIVFGFSQGGAQALVAAALDPQVSLCLAAAPAMSDHSGNLLGCQSGWPRLFAVKDGKPVDARVAEVSKYYDNVNFAKYIKAPVYMTACMNDTACVPTSVYAVFNNLPASTEKHMTILPASGHVHKNPLGYKVMDEILRGQSRR